MMWEKVAPFFDQARKKDPRLVSNKDIKAILLKSRHNILSIAYLPDRVVGVAIVQRVSEPLFGTHGLHVALTVSSGAPGFLKALHKECDSLATLESFDFTRFNFTRPGWKKLLKMEPEHGYKLQSYVAEKDYGRRRRS